MKVYFHYCTYGFSNCYILGTDIAPDNSQRDCIIVDPGCMDEKILRFIETNSYAVRGILVTHDHQNHVHGIRTLKKIYETEVYGINHIVCDHRTNIVRDGDSIPIGPFTVQVFSIPGHSSDSAVYRIDRILCTGDALSAGLVGSTASSYGTTIQAAAIRIKLFSLPGDYAVLPGHGPPSTLEAERRFNVGLEQSEKVQAQRVSFAREIW